MRLRLGIPLVLSLVSTEARAYQAESAVTSPCHEAMTMRALARFRASGGPAPLIAPTSDERALLDDLQTDVPDDDLARGALVIGVRDNDFKDLDPTDTTRLAHVHADPSSQREHCLRAPADDEPDGTEKALAACRGYIRERFELALAGLDEAGAVDPKRRVALPLRLDFRGRVVADLPATWVHLGQAMHALQDGFSHSYRTSDQKRVTVLLNYVDTLDDPEPSRDGPSHKGKLDACEDLDALRTTRLAVAEDASAKLLAAALSPGTTDERRARLEALLDDVLAYEPGCTAANHWCDAPEEKYEDPSCACTAAGAPGGTAALAAALLAGAAVVRRRRRLGVAAAVPAMLLALAPSEARAEEGGPWGAYAAGGGAIDQGAFNASLGGRRLLSPRWIVGADVEWNPWWSVNTRRVRPGTLNAYGTVIRRYDTRDPDWKLRTSLHLGTSTLLFDLFEAPKGTTGPYLGVNFLGLEIDLGKRWVLVVDPADFAVSVPQMKGTPLVYRQYRFTVGIQWGISS